MYKIMEEALRTEGKNLNNVSLAHLKGKVLLSLEKFKIDGDIRTLTVSSAIGLQKKGKKVTLIIPESYVQKEQEKVVTVEKEETVNEEIIASKEEETDKELSKESDSTEDSEESSEEVKESDSTEDSEENSEEVEEKVEEVEIVIPTVKANNKKRR